MYDRILVPLDGSRVAEAVLPFVAWLARGLEARVTLLAVVDPSDQAVAGHPTGRAGGESVERGGLPLRWYLEERARYLEMRRVEAEPLVVEAGDVPGEILAQARDRDCDLIAMATHGRSGLRRGLLGSVTDAVIRSSEIPVLAVGPHVLEHQQDAEPSLKRVIVTLDGSPLAEEVLPWVQELARRLSLEVLLVRAFSVPSWPYTGDDSPPLDPTPFERELEAEATQYLQGVARRLGDAGITARRTVLQGAPEASIIDFAQGVEQAMMALSTHGRSGLGRVIIGSVADRVIRTLEAPVLVIRPPDREAVPIEEGNLPAPPLRERPT